MRPSDLHSRRSARQCGRSVICGRLICIGPAHADGHCPATVQVCCGSVLTRIKCRDYRRLASVSPRLCFAHWPLNELDTLHTLPDQEHRHVLIFSASIRIECVAWINVSSHLTAAYLNMYSRRRTVDLVSNDRGIPNWIQLCLTFFVYRG